MRPIFQSKQKAKRLKKKIVRTYRHLELSIGAANVLASICLIYFLGLGYHSHFPPSLLTVFVCFCVRIIHAFR